MAGPEFQLDFAFRGGSAARNARGQFTSVAHSELAKLADRMAQNVQGRAVRNLQSSYVRPSVRTNRLVRVTADSKNRKSNRFGFAVGIDDFLNKSEAKYWRTIEEGSAATFKRGGMIGMALPFGFWARDLTGWGENRWGRVPHSGGGIPKRGGKLRPFSAQRRADLAAQGIKPVLIKREIQPHRYYAKAWEQTKAGTDYSKEGAKILQSVAKLALFPEV